MTWGESKTVLLGSRYKPGPRVARPSRMQMISGFPWVSTVGPYASRGAHATGRLPYQQQ